MKIIILILLIYFTRTNAQETEISGTCGKDCKYEKNNLELTIEVNGDIELKSWQ